MDKTTLNLRGFGHSTVFSLYYQEICMLAGLFPSLILLPLKGNSSASFAFSQCVEQPLLEINFGLKIAMGDLPWESQKLFSSHSPIIKLLWASTTCEW